MTGQYNARTIVFKVGSNILTHHNGKLDLRRLESLSCVLSDLRNKDYDVVLVSSGAVAAGVAKLGMEKRPDSTEGKQAAAAVGQAELINIYERFFGYYGHNVAQILLTRDVVENEQRRKNAENTFRFLLKIGCIPIVNENDSVSSEEIKFSGNDILSAYVAVLCGAGLLVNLSDVDGLFDRDPRTDPNAVLVPVVDSIDGTVSSYAGDAGTSRGTGGMIAKLEAARIALSHDIPMVILNGQDPRILYQLIEGNARGTYFPLKK